METELFCPCCCAISRACQILLFPTSLKMTFLQMLLEEYLTFLSTRNGSSLATLFQTHPTPSNTPYHRTQKIVEELDRSKVKVDASLVQGIPMEGPWREMILSHLKIILAHSKHLSPQIIYQEQSQCTL